MKQARPLVVAMSAVAALAAGCAGTDPYPVQSSSGQAAYASNFGVVDRIEVVRKDGGGNVAGTVIGGIIGGLIGHQIGSGSGNTAATIAGAAGGAYAGNRIQDRRRADNETFRISVRMDDGSTRTVTQENLTDLRTGDRVRVEGGSVFRV